MTISKIHCVRGEDGALLKIREQISPPTNSSQPVPKRQVTKIYNENHDAGYIVTGRELASELCKIPEGKVVTDNDLRKYFEAKHATKKVAFDYDQMPTNYENHAVPFWRVVSPKGYCIGAGRIMNRQFIIGLLESEGVPMIQMSKNSYRVKDLEKSRYDLNQEMM